MKRFPTVVVRGDILTSWLAISDYTRSRLASELGVSKGRISQLLTSREEPSAHLIAKLITLTRLPFDRLFKIVQDLPPAPPSRRIGRAAKKVALAGSASGARENGGTAHAGAS